MGERKDLGIGTLLHAPEWVAQVYSEAARAGPLIRNRHPVEHHRVFTKPSPLFASRTRTPSETQPYYVAVQTTHAFAFYFYSSPTRSMQPIAATMGRLRYAFVGAVALSLVLLIIAAPAPAIADTLSKRDVKEIAGDLKGALKEAKVDYKEVKVDLIGDFKSGDMTKSEYKEDLSAAKDDYREVAVATKAGLKGLKTVYKAKTDVGDTDALRTSINTAIEDPTLNPLDLVNTIIADIESASPSTPSPPPPEVNATVPAPPPPQEVNGTVPAPPPPPEVNGTVPAPSPPPEVNGTVPAGRRLLF